MSTSELAEHLGYLTDKTRLEAYRSALCEIVRPDSVVLDLGAGTGLLGLLAAQAGARRVYAVDGGPILELSRLVAWRSELGDRIVHIRGLSTRIDLPERVDVVVCDQIGGFVHDAGILGYYADAVARFLKPGGVLIPGSFRLCLTPIDDEQLERRVADWRSGPDGLDFTPFADAAANTEHHVNAPAGCALGPEAVIAEITADHDSHFGGSVELPIERPGRVCGVLGTFVARMSPSVTLTNAPWADQPMNRWQNFYPFAEASDVDAGDRVEASIDVSPRNGMVAWRGRIVRADGASGPSFAHDTLQGSFAGPRAIIRSSDKWTPSPTEHVPVARSVLDSLDATRSIDDLARLVREAHPGQFVSQHHARSFVRSVLGPVVHPSEG
ncbi:MAG: 50S ribosomal protein L11 methyltransferase [Acidimicrobiia bacterium]